MLLKKWIFGHTFIELLLFFSLHILFYIYELRVVKKLYFESHWICKNDITVHLILIHYNSTCCLYWTFKHIVIKDVGNSFVYIIYYEFTKVTLFQSSIISHHHVVKMWKNYSFTKWLLLGSKKINKLVKSWQSSDTSCVAESQCTFQYDLRIDSPLQERAGVRVRGKWITWN